MTTSPDEEYTDFEIKLAQRILCSTISVQMGITYQHCWKTYVEPSLAEDGKVGELYMQTARFIRLNLYTDRQAIFSGSIT